MIAVKIICVGKLKEKFYSQAVDELTKRLSRYCKLEIAEITDEKAPEQLSDTQREQLKAREGKRILERLTDGEYLIATAIDGQSLSSEQLAHDGGKEQIGICHRRVAGSVRRGVKARGL